ncbi:MAG: hypothetical protein GF331_26860, partial [Chitinivibrionales bacterium]|nr:hypothetical protein [Chitinivibrionales bacterium]
MQTHMNIVLLTSSFRRDGNTARLAGLLRDTVASLAADRDMSVSFETVHLAHEHIGMCRGCRVCFDRGEEHCPLRDAVLPIRDKLDAADGVVLASPVYVEDVNGVMKNWIDRMAFVCHRPAHFGKWAYVLSTTGVSATRHTLVTMSTALRTWGFSVVGQRAFVCGGSMSADEMNRRYGRDMERIAERVLRGARSGRQRAPSFYSLVVFRVQQA